MRRLPMRGVAAASCVAVLWLLAPACGRDPLVYGNLGDACFEDTQCQGELRCLEGRCELIDGVLPDGGFPDLDPPDFDPDLDPDLPPRVCRPGAVDCLDDRTVGVCSDDGAGYEAVEVCARGFCDGGFCVETPPQCREGEQRCDGSFTVTRCVNGQFQDWEMCPREAPCRQGACVPTGGELPDLAVQQISIRPAEIRPGQSITIDLRVANQGRADAFPALCDLFITANNPRPGRDTFLQRAPIEFLGAGERFSGAIRASVNVPPGRYRVYAACDADEQVEELNENNNLRVADLALNVVEDGQRRPDLAWGEIFVEGDFVRQGESVPIYGVFCNQGDADAFEVGVEVIAQNPNGLGGFVSLGRQFFRALAAGECMEFYFASNPIPCASPEDPFWTISGLLDPDGLVEESVENNNAFTNPQPLFVECDQGQCQGDRFDPTDVNAPPLVSPGRYDLTLCAGDVDALRLDLQTGDIVRGLVQLNEPIPVYAELLAEGAPEPLLLGAEVFDAIEFETQPVPASGRYLLLITPLVTEDVTYTFEYEIERAGNLPELLVRNLSGSITGDPNGRQVFNYSFEVVNQGRGGAGGSSTRLQLSDPFGDVFAERDDNTNALMSGQSQRFSGQLALPIAPQVGAWTLSVTADVTARVRETNEANNTARVTREVNGDAGCEDPLEPNNSVEQPAPVEEATYEGLRLCAADNNDYYLLCPPMGTTAMTITLNFQHSRGDIDMTLFNDQMRRVAQANGVRDTEQILYADLRGGCYTLRAYLFGGANVANDYTMTITYEGEPEPVCEDQAEPNNNFLNSPRLENLPNESALTFCPASDVDFFQLQLSEGQIFSVGARPEAMVPGEISLTLYGPDLNFITQVFEAAPALDYVAEQSGIHYLRAATSAEVDSFPYVLEWSAAP